MTTILNWTITAGHFQLVYNLISSFKRTDVDRKVGRNSLMILEIPVIGKHFSDLWLVPGASSRGLPHRPSNFYHGCPD